MKEYKNQYPELADELEEKIMKAEKQTKSANFLRIVAILKSLRDQGKISPKEYVRRLKENAYQEDPLPRRLLERQEK